MEHEKDLIDDGALAGCEVRGELGLVELDRVFRSGYMIHNEGNEMLRKYDHVPSSDLHHWLGYVGHSEEWLDTFRSPKIWATDGGFWHKRNIWDQK